MFSSYTSIFWYKQGKLARNKILGSLNNTPRNVNMHEVAIFKILENVKSKLKP